MNLQPIFYFLISLAVLELISDFITKTPLWLFTQCYYAYFRMWKTTVHLRNIISYDWRKNDTEIENQFSRWSPRLGNYVTLHAIKAVSRNNEEPTPAIELIESNVYQHKPTVLLGEPGSGKTTVIEALVYKLAFRAYKIRIVYWFFTILISGLLVLIFPAYSLIWMVSFIFWEPLFQRVAVPIFVKARSEYTGGNVDQWYETMVSQALGPRPIFKWKNIVFVVDGINETQDNVYGMFIEGWRKMIISQKKQSLLFTSRSGEDPSERLSINNTLTILDLDDNGINKFLQVYGDQKAKLEKKTYSVAQSKKDFSELVKKGLLGQKGIGRNPYWLKLMVENGLYTRNRGVLFDSFCRRLLRRELIEKPEDRKRHPSWQTVDIEFEIDCLAQLALYMHKKGSIGLSGKEGWEESVSTIHSMLFSTQLKPLDVFLEARSASLLRIQRNEQVEFVHQLVQEYFAAYAMKDERSWSSAFQNIENVAWWETIFLLGGLIDNVSRELFTEFLKRVLRRGDSDYSIFVAVALLQHVENPELETRKIVYESFISSVGETLSELQKKSVFELGRLIGDEAAEAFASLINSEDINVQKRGILLLKTLGDKKSVEILLRTLKIPQLHLDGHKALVEVSVHHREILREKISDIDWRVRWGITEILGEIGNPSEDGFIKVGLQDDNWYVQWGTINALRNMQYFEPLIEMFERASPDLLPWVSDAIMGLSAGNKIQPIIKALGDDDPQKRNQSISILTNIGFSNVELLIDALSDRNWRIRYEVAGILGDIRDTRAIVPLVALLRDSYPAVRQRAKTSIKNSGVQASVQLNKMLESHIDDNYLRLQVIDVLGEIDGATEILIDNLYSKDKSIRISSISKLGQSRSLAAFHALAKALDSTDDLLPIVIDALSNFGSQSTELLLKFLQDTDPQVRDSAARALGKIKDKHAISVLSQLLHQKGIHEHVRQLAAFVLGKISDQSSIKVLIDTLEDPSMRVVLSAVDALGEIGSRAIPSLIQTAIKADYWLVRSNAVKALGQIEDQRAIDFLLSLEDKDSRVQEEVYETISTWRTRHRSFSQDYGEERLQEVSEKVLDDNMFVEKQTTNFAWVERLLSGLNGDDLYMKQQASIALKNVAIGPLINALVNTGTAVQAGLIDVLANIGDPAYEVLVEKLTDKDAAIRVTAARILIQVGEPAIISLFETFKYSTESLQDHIIAVLFEIGKPVPPFLLRQLVSSDNKSQAAARRILIALGPKSVEHLVEILSDEEALLGGELRSILGEIGERAIDPLISILEKEKNVSCVEDLLVDMGARSIPKLIEAVRARRMKTKKRLLDILVKLSPLSIDPAIELLSLRETEEDGVYILKKIGKLALNSLMEAIEDVNPKISNCVPKVIISIGEPAVEYMIEKIDSDDAYVSSLAVEVVEKTGEFMKDYLVRTICSGDSISQDKILNVVRKLGAIMIEPIVNLLDQPIRIEKKLLLEVLRQMGASSVQKLILGVPYSETEISSAITNTITSIGEKAVKPILDIFPQLHNQQRDFALELLSQIGRSSVRSLLILVNNSKPDQRGQILRHLVKIGPQAIPILLEATYCQYLCRSALKALNEFSNGQLSLELYLKSLQDNRQRQRAILLAKKLNLLDVELHLRSHTPKMQYMRMVKDKLDSLSSSTDFFDRLPEKVVVSLRRISLENKTGVIE